MEIKIKKNVFWTAIVIIAVLALFFIWRGFSGSGSVNTTPIQGSSFSSTGDSVLLDSAGKPYVIMFSTTWCPHCQWVKPVFNNLTQESFADQIDLQHWDLDTGDNELTPQVETEVPSDILDIYNHYNPSGSIPTFVFGGKYLRIGTGYESQGDAGLTAEKTDFEFIINKLLSGQ